MDDTLMNNLTVAQQEILEEFNPEYDSYISFSRAVVLINIITTIAKFLLCLVVLAADIFLIVIVSRNAKLKCKTNSYFIHYATFNIVAIVVTPIFLILLAVLNVNPMAGVFFYYCVDVQIESTALSMCFLVGICLCIDWLFEVYNPAWKEKFEAVYRYSIVVVYVVAIFKMGFTAANCFLIIKGTWFLTYFYGSILAFNIFVNVLNYRMKPAHHKRSYSLTAANIIILSWLPMFIYEILWVCFKGRTIMEDVLTMIGFIPEWIGYGSPIVLLYVLGKMNKDFKRVYIRAFKRRAKDYNEEDDLEESTDGKDTGENITIPPNVQVL